MRVASILKGKTRPIGYKPFIAPGSKQVTICWPKTALWRPDRRRAKFWNVPAACISMGQSPIQGISLRTFNRNFEGRSGTADGQIYPGQPETAAVSASSRRIYRS